MVLPAGPPSWPTPPHDFIMWSTGVGSDVMKPIATPIIGGMVTSTIHVLVITPVIFYIMKRRALRKGRLIVSGMNV